MTKSSDELLLNFNRLIYEYLVKSKYEKSAEAFKLETKMQDIRLTDTPPVLLNWYNIFIETADVRSGKSYMPETLNRIEGIMLKLENDKRRYAKMNVVANAGAGIPPQMKNMERIHKSERGGNAEYGRINNQEYVKPCGPANDRGFDNNYDYLQQVENDRIGHRSVERSVNTQPERMDYHSMQRNQYPGKALLREFRRVEMHLPYIYNTQYCNNSKILVSTCADGKVYFYNIMTNILEFSFNLVTRQIIGVKCTEIKDLICLVYELDKNTIILSKYYKGRKEDVKTIFFKEVIQGYCIGSNGLFILLENGIMISFSLSGEKIKEFDIGGNVKIIEYFFDYILLIEQGRVRLYEYLTCSEPGVLAEGNFTMVAVKDTYAFIIYPDSIHIFCPTMPYLLKKVFSTISCRDMAYINNTLAVCTGNEVYYGELIAPLIGSLNVYGINIPGFSGLLIVTAEGIITFMK